MLDVLVTFLWPSCGMTTLLLYAVYVHYNMTEMGMLLHQLKTFKMQQLTKLSGGAQKQNPQSRKDYWQNRDPTEELSRQTQTLHTHLTRGCQQVNCC